MEKQTTHEKFGFALGTVALTDDSGKRQFSGIAYSGQTIENHPAWGRVIFDLSSTHIPDSSLPILLEHDRSKRIGFTQGFSVDEQITIDGEMLSNTLAQSVINDADEGFPWQMSVHIVPDVIEEVPIDKPITVNGQQFSGGFVFRNNIIREISFTPTGWDRHTHANIFEYTGEINVPDSNTEALASLQTENADLKASNTDLKNKVSELEQTINEMKASQRTEQVKTLFGDLGQEYSEDSAKAYMLMDDTTFSAVAADLRKIKPQADSHLFSEQATGGVADKQFSLADQMKTLVGVN